MRLAQVLAGLLGPALREQVADVGQDALEAIGGELDRVAGYVSDRPGYPGGSLATDLNRSPSIAWLLQWPGVRYRDDLDVAANRARGRSRRESTRGTVEHLQAVAQEYLGGSKRVEITERHGGDSRAVRVRVFAAELVGTVTDLEAALNRALSWTITLTLEVAAGQSYAQLKATGDTYAQLKAQYPTIAQMTYSQPEA